jgi:UDP-glucose 4-epimerase
MNCLVLGGAGFIGSHIVDALTARGHAVRVFDLPNISLENIKSHIGKIQIIHGDFNNISDISLALDDMDVVFHLASSTLPGPSNENPVYDVESNLVGTLNLLQKSVEKNIKKIIFPSSGGTIYGVPERLPISETHATNPICSYGITKLMIEKYILLFHHLYGINYTILRLGNPFGERQKIENVQGAVAVFLGKLSRKEPITIWGDGSVARDFFYISDLVESFVLAAENESLCGIFNIASGQAISVSQLVGTIEKLTGCEFIINYSAARKLDVPVNCLDIEKAENVLGWRPKVSLADGIMRMWRWLAAMQG